MLGTLVWTVVLLSMSMRWSPDARPLSYHGAMSTQQQAIPTQRQVFDRVRAHLLAQARRSQFTDVEPLIGGNMCRYRMVDTDGRRLACAVGCLIDPQIEDWQVEAAEGISVVSLQRTEDGRWNTGPDDRRGTLADLLNRSGVPGTREVQRTLILLQELHDGDDPATWPARLEEMEARLFGGPETEVGA